MPSPILSLTEIEMNTSFHGLGMGADRETCTVYKVPGCGCSWREKLHGGEGCFVELDFIFRVVGATCAEALWLVRANPRSSMCLEKEVSDWDGWGEWLDIRPERKVGASLALAENLDLQRLGNKGRE